MPSPSLWSHWTPLARGHGVCLAVLVVALACLPSRAETGPGSVDPGFRATFDPGPNPVLRDLAVDTQDRVLVSGDYEVFRLLPDGTLDASFPKSSTDDWIFTLVPTSDGGLYVGGRFRHFRGESHAGIVKLTANGDIDPAFRPSSEGVRDVYAIAPHPEGGLIVGGYFDTWDGLWVKDLVRLLPDASLDRAFTTNQAPVQDGFRTPVDRQILARGNGTFLMQRGQIEVVSWDGRLLATHPATGPWASLDADRVVVAETIYEAGQVRSIRVFAIRNDGTIDPSLEAVHACDGPVRALAVLSDGRILVGGRFTVLGDQRHAGLARLNVDGSIDAGFVSDLGNQESVAWENGDGWVWISQIRPLGDGSLYAGGYFTNAGPHQVTSVARLLGGVRDSAVPMARQSGGSVMVTEGHSLRLGFSVESATSFGGTWSKDGIDLANGREPVLQLENLQRNDAGRYQLRLTNAMGEIVCPAVDLQVAIGPTHPGSVDVSFRVGTVLSDRVGPNLGPVRGAVAAGDRIYVFSSGNLTGLISSVEGHPTLGMARLGLDGQVDRTFVMLRGSTNAARLLGVQSVLPLADGRVLAQITLPATSPIRRTTNVIVAMHPDGTPDVGFSVAAQPWSLSSVIYPLGLAPNGGILVGGLIRWDGDSGIRTVVRLRADGSVDPAFRPIEGSQTPSSVLWQSTGRLLVVSKEVTASGRAVGVVKRYLADGTPDPTFRVDPPIESLIAGAVVDAQDRLLISFVSNSTDSVTGSLILRLLPEGGRDLSFAEIRVPKGFSFQTYHSLSLQSDGRILAIPSAVGPKTSVVRWLPDGRPDPEFQLELDAGSFETVGVISGDRILIAGSFAEEGGTERRGVAILNASTNDDGKGRSGERGRSKDGSAVARSADTSSKPRTIRAGTPGKWFRPWLEMVRPFVFGRSPSATVSIACDWNSGSGLVASRRAMKPTPAQTWTRFQTYYREFPACGLSVDLSRLTFDDDFLTRMAAPMAKAFEAMAALEKGAIANPDEKRRVGHYWLRDAALAPEPALREMIAAALEDVKSFATAVHEGRIAGQRGAFEHLLVIGIGGSALGPQLVANALGHPLRDRMSVRFFDNTDPDGMDRVLAPIVDQLGKTLVLVISKSGGTPETRNGMLEAEAAYRRAGLDFAKHAVAVTQLDDKSSLHVLAREKGWLAQFPMWDWVGGRTSVTSAVGLLPAALQGLDIDALLAGARACDTQTRAASVDSNPAALLALAWYHAGGGRGAKDMVVLPYKDRLDLFSKYLQQLIMESLGKELDLDGRVVNQGIAVYGNKGSTDQHAYVQQLREGLNNFFATFIEVLKDRNGESIDVEPGVTAGDFLHGFLLGTRSALSEKGRESVTLTISEVNAFTLGSLIALFERTVGLYANLVRINAYHQPGVEAGKKAAAGVIRIKVALVNLLRSAPEKGFDAETLSTLLAPALPDLVVPPETVFKLCEHLVANGATSGIRKTAGPTPTQALYSFSPGGVR